MAKKAKPTAAQQNEPNIMFVGKGTLTPVQSISNGMDTITLPSDQSAAFYHPQAAVIVRLFPNLYKQYVIKGAK